MHKKRLAGSTTLLGLALLSACGGEALSPCAALAEKTRACFGVEVWIESCNPAT